MAEFTTRDRTQIFYKDWGTGQPIVFSHGWPLSSDDWDAQMLFFLHHGYRVIAHDRRGHGRSAQPSEGNDMDHYADDLADLTAHLDLHDAVHVGHSAGGGEVARYIGRHGESRVAKAVLISAVTPSVLQTEANPAGVPKAAFEGLQAFKGGLGHARRVGVGLQHRRRYRADQRRLRHTALAVAADVASHLAATGRVPDVDGVAQVEVRGQGGQVIGVVVHVVAVPRLGRAPVAAPVVGDRAVAV